MSRIMFRTVFPNRSIANYKFLQHGFLSCHSKSVKFYSSLSERKFGQNSKIGPNQIGTVGVISGSLLSQVRTLSSGSETTVTALDSATTIVESALTEPSFQSLGLANLYPPGWLQYAMEQIHLQFDMPWWATIMIGTQMSGYKTLSSHFPFTIILLTPNKTSKFWFTPYLFSNLPSIII